MFTASSSVETTLYNHNKMMKVITLSGHERKLTQVKFNRDSDLCFTAGADKIVTVWDTSTGERLGTYDGHQGVINGLDIDDDSKYLLTGSGDASVRIWTIENGETIHKFNTYSPISSVQYSFGEKLFLATTRQFRNKQSCIHVYINPVHSNDDVDVDDDDDEEKKEEKKVSIDIENSLNQTNFGISKGIWSPTNEYIFALCTDGTIRIIDTLKATEIKKIIFDDTTYNQYINGKSNGSELKLTDIQYNDCNDFQTVIVCSRNKQAKMYDIRDNKWDELSKYSCDTQLNAICIHPKLNLMAEGGGIDAVDAALTNDKGKYDPIFCHTIFGEYMGKIETNCFSPLNSMDWNNNGSQLILGYEQGEAQLITFNKQFDLEFCEREKRFTPEDND